MSDDYAPSFSFEHVKDAIVYAIGKKDYEPLDFIIDQDIGSFAQVQHRQTSVFMAVNQVLGESITLADNDRPYLLGCVLATLEHIFEKVDQKLGSNPDKELLHAFVHTSCNHISPTSMLESGATVRDIMEHYAGVDVTEKPHDKAYMGLYKLVQEYGLEQKNILFHERLKTTTSSGKGR